MATRESVVQIKPLEIEKITVRLIGEPPGLLQCRFSEEDQQILKQYEPGEIKRPQGEKIDPEKVWRRRLHVINADEGRYGYPAGGIKKALVRAGTDAGLKMTDLRRRIRIPAALVEVLGVPQRLTVWGIPPGQKAPMLIHRPHFPEWKMDVPVMFNRNLMSKEQIIDLFQHAGFGVGFGSWRPERDGSYGCFRVALPEDEA